MYKFNFRSIDGNHSDSYESLEEFAKDWTSGSVDGFEGGQFVTSDGITVITPADDFTRDEILRENMLTHADYLFRGVDELGELKRSSVNAINPLQLPSGREFTRLSLTESNPELFGKYIDLEIGRAFMLDASDPLVDKVLPNQKALEKMGLPAGSMSLRDTYVAHDKLARKVIVVDTRKEAESIEEMTARAIDKTPVLFVDIELNEGFNDDGVYAKVAASGDKDLIAQSVAKLEEAFKDDYCCDYCLGGYSNSKENPLSQTLFSDLIRLNDFAESFKMINKQEAKENGVNWNNTFNVVKVTRQLINASGSTEKGIHVEMNGKAEFYQEGKVIKELSTDHAFDKNYVEMTVDEMKENIRLTKEQDAKLEPIF